jgi:ABC-2 type transport system permease protein
MSPRVIGANLIVSIKSFYREKTAVFFRIAFPVILILVFGTIFMNQDNVRYDFYVQDLDGTKLSTELVDILKLSERFKITTVDPAIDAAQYARDNKLNLVVVIPKDYQSSLVERIKHKDLDATVTVTYIYDPSSTSVNTKMQILNSVFARINQKMSGKPPFIRLVETSILSERYRFIDFFVPGIIAMTIMTSSLLGAVNVNAELRQKGVIKKLSTTPITHTDWILSNVLYQFLLSVIATITILAVSYGVFHVSLQMNFWLPVFVVLDVFAFVGIGMILTRVAKEAESAAAAANVIMFPMMFLSGTFFPVEMMPDFLQKFSRILPLYYVNEGLRASMIFTDNAIALRCAVIIGIFAAIVFVLGVMTTKWEDG